MVSRTKILLLITLLFLAAFCAFFSACFSEAGLLDNDGNNGIDITDDDDDNSISGTPRVDAQFSPGDDDDDDIQTSSLQVMEGGRPGLLGTAIGIAPDSSEYVAVVTAGHYLYLYSHPKNALAWSRELISDCAEYQTAGHFDLKVDSTGLPHIVFQNTCFNALSHATLIDGKWQSRIIDDSGNDVGKYPSLFIDENDTLYVSYHGWNSGSIDTIRYANNVTGSWRISALNHTVALGEESALAVDTNGAAHIVTTKYQQVTYASNRAGAWQFETIEFTFNRAFAYPSIALDQDGFAHVLYQTELNPGEQALKYVTNKTGTWVATNIDTANAGFGTQLLLANDGTLRLLYGKKIGTDVDVYYATGESGEFVLNNLTQGPAWGLNPSFALLPGGGAKIVYYGPGATLRMTLFGSTLWTNEPIDENGTAGYSLDMKLDNQGNLHVAHIDVENNQLKVSSNAEGTWVVNTIDNFTNALDSKPKLSMVLDDDGFTHLTYFDDTNRDLKYATNRSGAWVTDTLEHSVGIVGEFNAISLTEDGQLYIAYHDGETKELMFLTRSLDETTWDAAPIADPTPSMPLPGLHASMAISGNSVHIAHGHSGLHYTTTPDIGVVDWLTEESIDRKATYTSIDVDSAGFVHIGYVFASLGEFGLLKYATNKNGWWNTQMIGLFLTSGPVQLRVDNSDNVHMVHTEDDGIRYSTNESGRRWRYSLLEDSGEIGADSALEIDAQNNVHVVYNCDDAIKYVVFSPGSTMR